MSILGNGDVPTRQLLLVTLIDRGYHIYKNIWVASQMAAGWQKNDRKISVGTGLTKHSRLSLKHLHAHYCFKHSANFSLDIIFVSSLMFVKRAKIRFP